MRGKKQDYGRTSNEDSENNNSLVFGGFSSTDISLEPAVNICLLAREKKNPPDNDITSNS